MDFFFLMLNMDSYNLCRQCCVQSDNYYFASDKLLCLIVVTSSEEKSDEEVRTSREPVAKEYEPNFLINHKYPS